MQSRGDGPNQGTRNKFPPSTRTLKAYDLLFGTLLFLTKQAPTPRLKANIFMDYDIRSGKIVIPKDLKTKLDNLDVILSGRIENNKIQMLDEEETEELKG